MTMNQKSDTIQVHVTFAAAPKPFHDQYEPSVTLEQVLRDVLTTFEIDTDGTTRYYLFASGAEVAGAQTVGQLATNPGGHERALHLSLRTETVSGAE